MNRDWAGRRPCLSCSSPFTAGRGRGRTPLLERAGPHVGTSTAAARYAPASSGRGPWRVPTSKSSCAPIRPSARERQARRRSPSPLGMSQYRRKPGRSEDRTRPPTARAQAPATTAPAGARRAHADTVRRGRQPEVGECDGCRDRAERAAAIRRHQGPPRTEPEARARASARDDDENEPARGRQVRRGACLRSSDVAETVTPEIR